MHNTGYPLSILCPVFNYQVITSIYNSPSAHITIEKQKTRSGFNPPPPTLKHFGQHQHPYCVQNQSVSLLITLEENMQKLCLFSVLNFPCMYLIVRTVLQTLSLSAVDSSLFLGFAGYTYIYRFIVSLNWLISNELSCLCR